MADGSLHIVMFPWLAFGHMITFLELSKSLAKRGHHISFLSTPRNILRLPKLPPTLAPLIDFIPHWVSPIAAELHIPCAMLNLFPAYFNAFIYGPDGMGMRRSAGQLIVAPEWIPFPTAAAYRPFEGPGDKPMIVVRYKGEEKHLVPEGISPMVLTKMEIAEAYLGMHGACGQVSEEC